MLSILSDKDLLFFLVTFFTFLLVVGCWLAVGCLMVGCWLGCWLGILALILKTVESISFTIVPLLVALTVRNPHFSKLSKADLYDCLVRPISLKSPTSASPASKPNPGVLRALIAMVESSIYSLWCFFNNSFVAAERVRLMYVWLIVPHRVSCVDKSDSTLRNYELSRGIFRLPPALIMGSVFTRNLLYFILGVIFEQGFYDGITGHTKSNQGNHYPQGDSGTLLSPRIDDLPVYTEKVSKFILCYS